MIDRFLCLELATSLHPTHRKPIAANRSIIAARIVPGDVTTRPRGLKPGGKRI